MSKKKANGGLDKALVADTLRRLSEAQQLVTFDRGVHSYRISGVPHMSVTKVLDIIDKPALKYWAANCEREACAAAAESWIKSGGAGSIADVFERVKHAFRRYQKAAKDIGTEAHEAIEFILKQRLSPIPGAVAPTIGNTAQYVVSAWKRWDEEFEFRPLAVEKNLFNQKAKVAGRMDFLAEVPKHPLLEGRFVIFDWLTSDKDIYKEKILQVNTYRGMFADMFDLDPETQVGGLILRLPKGPGEPEMKPLDWDKGAYKAVLWAKPLAEWLQGR